MSQAGIKVNVGPGSGLVRYLEGNNGGLVGPNAAQTIFVLGGNNITVSGNPGTFTETFSVTGNTNHSVLLGNATGSINSLVNGTTGQVLHAITGANDPVWSAVSLTADVSGILPIANGGTNANAMATTFGVNYFDGTRIVTTAVGTATHVLTSNGVGVAPTFQALPAGGIVTINGDTGSVTGATVTLTATGIAKVGPTWSFSGAGTTLTMLSTDANFNIVTGKDSGNASLIANGATQNSVYGRLSGGALTSGTNNELYGYLAGGSITTGTFNTMMGSAAGSGMLSGTRNQFIGWGAGYQITSGSYNLICGPLSGGNYTSSESNNVTLANSGVLGESNVMRLGTSGSGVGQVNKTFIGGIDGVNVGSVAKVLTMASNQLGTAAITAGAGISVTPGANLITIAATGMGSFAWSVITIDQTAVVFNGYICNKAGTLALLLPATAAIGDIIEVTGINTATGIQVTQNALQQIFFGTGSTTIGITGSLTSTAIRDSLRMVCVVAGASTNWNVISSVGNWTIA